MTKVIILTTLLCVLSSGCSSITSRDVTVGASAATGAAAGAAVGGAFAKGPGALVGAAVGGLSGAMAGIMLTSGSKTAPDIKQLTEKQTINQSPIEPYSTRPTIAPVEPTVYPRDTDNGVYNFPIDPDKVDLTGIEDLIEESLDEEVVVEVPDAKKIDI